MVQPFDQTTIQPGGLRMKEHYMKIEAKADFEQSSIK
jgi:hypothetical protein